MASFKGTYVHLMDAKGRIAFPIRLRSQIPEGGTLTVAAEDCLTFYPADLWHDVERELVDLDPLNPDARDTKRQIFGSAEDATFDRQGRIAIPGHLREHAGLAKEVVVIGVGDLIELWDAVTWQERHDRIATNASNIMRRARGGDPHSP
jgi:MraZ protein